MIVARWVAGIGLVIYVEPTEPRIVILNPQTVGASTTDSVLAYVR
jgi:hypothetical protein